ncbi:MAG: aspartate ammonia-lyase [Xanthobacteraceae bacterium]|nr:aspartate ammonia-lyase [Xanthobacteraceae bacterium]QYK46572.1 MAG: aspartate ammonia-lyase [Xanthobacteraceae bacterium]
MVNIGIITANSDYDLVVVRRERDSLGEMDIEENRYWGIHTERAVRNFPITGISIGKFPELIRALMLVKIAAARGNRMVGALSSANAEAIEMACDRLMSEPAFSRQFPVDIIQGGAGTSTNMNANEVIANLAIEILGGIRGDYKLVSPHDDVNMSQSTNDAYPTALRLAVLMAAEPLLKAMEQLAEEMARKGAEFAHILKIGRTQLQEAVPMTLGQEFSAFAVTIREDVERIQESLRHFCEVNLGGTAIGTGLNARARYAEKAITELAALTGYPIKQAPDLVEATSDMGAFVLFSGVLKRVAVKLSKICNDLRLLASGPGAGFAEIKLPAVQAGSSIMPGKVNPVIPEVVNQVAYLVIGHDLTVTMCAEAGQLQLNAFEPTIGYCVLSSIRYLTSSINTLSARCIVGIEANETRCREVAETSVGLATALAPFIGYENSARIAKRALAENRRVAELVLEEGILSEEAVRKFLSAEAMTKPVRSE